MVIMENFRELVREKISNRKIRIFDFPNFKKSAVILLFYVRDNVPFIIFEKRQKHLKNHSGEVSLPGGEIEPGKDKNLLDTVFRETFEEIGIDKSQIKIIGRIDDMFTLTSHYIVSTYIGEINNFDINKVTINKDEVAEVFEVPINVFLDETNFSEKFWTIKNRKIPIQYYTYKNYIIWGATGYIINKFIQIVFDFNPSSMKDFDRMDPDLVIK